METRLERIKEHLDRLSQFNMTPGKGITRYSYSPEDRQARDYLIDYMEELGLDVSVDPIGNIRARLEGTAPQAPIVMTGSHIDTVLHGGKFDGPAGVAASLEAITVMVEEGIKPVNPIELIIFVEEEGSGFNLPMAGSKSLIGEYSIEDMKEAYNNQGISMYQAAKDFGLEVDNIADHQIKPGQVKAMLELHIEQSVVLDANEIPVGIIEGIAGMKWVKIELQGVGNHAGATPMDYRHDPMVGAGQLITAIDRISKEEALPTTVGTVGKIQCYPNVANVIPERVELVLDVRDVDGKVIDLLLLGVKEELTRIGEEYGLETKLEIMGEIDPIQVSENVVKTLRNSAEKRGIEYNMMNSGALHDTAVLGSLTDIGMIFVPSIDGRSHVPEEDTNYKDIKLGADILLDSIIELASK